ncbi:hypothetical protein Hdeb2414_s0847g00953631 [Helianthus debilis subsp. tardiflorus]
MGQFAYLEEQSGKMGLLCLQKASMFPSRGKILKFLVLFPVKWVKQDVFNSGALD